MIQSKTKDTFSHRKSNDTLRIAVIGLGFAGIAMCVNLKKAGFEEFTVFESAEAPGGTWHYNTYPGAETDTPSHLYSFSFKQKSWSRPFAKQSELQTYLEETVDEWELRAHCSFGTTVRSVIWSERSKNYTLATTDGEVYVFDVVISSVGLLNVPRTPSWEGSEEFRGHIVHTARWTAGLELKGKRVGVVGTGSSAAQVIPAAALVAEKVTVFQRQPAWVDYKEKTAFSPFVARVLSSKIGYRVRRTFLYARQEMNWIGGRIARPGSRADKKAMARCERHLEEWFKDDPNLHRVLRPKIPYLAKRPVRSNEYFPALKRANVSIVPYAVDKFHSGGVIDSEGGEHELDIVVTATGFRPAEFLCGLEVIGLDDISIHDYWQEDPKAYLGIVVPGFPNFFMQYGPNTNNYAVVFNLEKQAKFIAQTLTLMIRRKAKVATVKESAFETFNSWLETRLAKTSFVAAESYFRSSSGKVVTQWPDGAILYWILTKLAPRYAMSYTGIRSDR